MGRRRSGGSGTTRLLQGLFALAWIVFLCYMVSGYLGRQPKDENAQLDLNKAQNVGDGGDESSSLSSALTVSNVNSQNQSPDALPVSGPSASEIIQRVIAAYRNAEAYSDDGKLIMSSIINGAQFKVDHPWSIRWKKNGLLSADIFDASVRGDGKRLSCFVSSIEKQNLDNQQLFLTGRALINQLYRDPIANFYLNGGDKIALNEAVIPESTKLAPVALSLLTGQAPSSWFQQPSDLTRLSDEVLKDRNENPVADCYVIRIVSPQSTDGVLTVWIDKQDSIVRQMKFPLEYLDPLIASDPNIKNYQLIASMPRAKFAVSEKPFDPVYPRNREVWPVSKFVATPQPLPSSLIGQLIPEFELLDSNRGVVTDRNLLGKTTVQLWLSGSEFDAELVKRFEKIKSAAQDRSLGFVVVAGPESLRTENGSWTFSKKLQPIINRSTLSFVADKEGMAGKSFEFDSLPSVVVTDSDSIIQYAHQVTSPAGFNGIPEISKNWDQRLLSAIAAVQKGTNVAQDMLVAYRTQLDQYDAEKNQYLAAKLFPRFDIQGRQKLAAIPANVRRDKLTDKAVLQLNPKLVWKSDVLEMPGGIAEVLDQNRNPTRHLILDGWQTITMFSLDGKKLGQKRLQLPPRAAITSIRPVRSSDGQSAFAMFSVGGQQVFLFDGKMNLVDVFPKQPDTTESVLACEVIQGAADQDDKLLICFSGSRGAEMVYPFTGTIKKAGPSVVRATAISGRDVVAVDDQTGALRSMDVNDGRVIDGTRDYFHVSGGAIGATKFAATAKNEQQEWSLIGLGNDLQPAFDFPIASAIFDNGLEPIAGVKTSPNKGIWAVADTTNRIFLLSDTGQWLGQLKGEGKVRGISLIQVKNRTRLIVSTDKLVECWDLNLAAERIGQIGTRTE